MEYKNSSVYDNEFFFKHYMDRRHRDGSPNITMEKPSLIELIGNVENNDIFDLGCGDASLGIELYMKNCKSYTGIDGSINMCNKAIQNLEGSSGKIIHSTMQDYEYPFELYDLVVSQLALHYVEDLERLMDHVFQTLKNEGQFVFSVQHPIITCSSESMKKSEKRTNWIVDHYFCSGKRVEPWLGENVVKFHRTIEEYFDVLQNSGFVIQSIKEAAPRKENFSSESEYERRRRIPLFLLFSCKKP
ncbi:class I SAM-dependent DNA methyltransferase [Heyndrickxia sporothermodurans]